MEFKDVKVGQWYECKFPKRGVALAVDPVIGTVDLLFGDGEDTFHACYLSPLDEPTEPKEDECSSNKTT